MVKPPERDKEVRLRGCRRDSRRALPSLAYERGEQLPGGGAGSACPGHDFRFEASEVLRDGGCRPETIEQTVANLGPQRRARLLGAPARPGASLSECGAEPGDVVPDLANAAPLERRDGTDRDLPLDIAR